MHMKLNSNIFESTIVEYENVISDIYNTFIVLVMLVLHVRSIIPLQAIQDQSHWKNWNYNSLHTSRPRKYFYWHLLVNANFPMIYFFSMFMSWFTKWNQNF